MAEHSDKSDDNSFFLVRIAMKVTRSERGDSFNKAQIANAFKKAFNFSCLSNYLKEIKVLKPHCQKVPASLSTW